MGDTAVVQIILFLIGGVFSVLWFLLKQKDDQQAKQISELFRKHEIDADALSDLKIKLASLHYEKSDIDRKFDKIDQSIKDGFKSMGERFDEFHKSISQHIQEYHKN